MIANIRCVAVFSTTDFCHIVGLAFWKFFVVVAVLVAYPFVFLFVAASSF